LYENTHNLLPDAFGYASQVLKNEEKIMALLNILQYPDERLHTVAKTVEKVDERIQKLVADMFETMYEARGIGLAATQVDVHERVVVMDLTEDRSEPRVFINPVIVEKDGETTYEEGCLSVPGIYDTVTRAERVKVEALNEKGEKFTLEADGLLAICVQHELDHLMGIVFVERLSQLKQGRIKTKLKKRQKHTI
jgi:peptide deformylase